MPVFALYQTYRVIPGAVTPRLYGTEGVLKKNHWFFLLLECWSSWEASNAHFSVVDKTVISFLLRTGERSNARQSVYKDHQPPVTSSRVPFAAFIF